MENSNLEVGSTMRDKLAAKGIELKLVPHEQAPLTPEEEIRELIQKTPSDAPRGGRGTQAGPELGTALEPFKEKPPVSSPEVAKKIREKDRWLINLADLRVREKQALEENLSQETKDNIAENIRDAQKRILELNESLGEIDPVADQEKIQRVITEWEETKRTASETNHPEISPETAEKTAFLDEEAKLTKSLETGEGYVRGGLEAEKAIEALMQKNEKEAPEMPPQTPEGSPAQSAYSTALDEIWREHEEKRKSAGENIGENLALEPHAPKPLMPEKVPFAPEGAPGPHLVARQEKIDGPSPIIEGQAARLLEDKTPEQLKQEKLEKMRARLDTMLGVNKTIETRAEKVGAVEHIRNIGEWWNKVPKRYKYMAAGAMFATGGGAWALGYMATSRILGSIGLFATFDALLQGRYEKKTGGVRSDEAAKRHAILAGIGALVVVGILGKVGSEAAGFLKGEATSIGQYVEGKIHTGVHTPSLPNELVANQISAENKGLTDLAQAIQEGNTEHIRLGEETLGISHEDALKLIHERGITAGGTENAPGWAQEIEKKLQAAHLTPEEGGELGREAGKAAAAGDTGKLLEIQNRMGLTNDEFSKILKMTGATTGIPLEKLTEFSTIKEGQGFWQPIHNQLAALHPDWTAEHLNHDTQELLVKNGIINANGSELQISNVGTHVVLNPDNTITYDHGAVYPAAPEPEVAGGVAPHAPVPTGDGYLVHAMPDNAPTIPSEIAPVSTELVTAANLSLHDDINNLFGTKGIMGFFAQDGLKSISWSDPQIGFAHQSVENVLSTHPTAFTPEGGVQTFGMSSYADHQKMVDYLGKVAKETGITAHGGENVSDYIKRAMLATLTKPKI